MKTQRRVISVPEGNFDEVIDTLQSKGFRIDQRMPDIGIVTGDLADADEADIRTIPGVKVEEEASYQLPPPDSKIQ